MSSVVSIQESTQNQYAVMAPDGDSIRIPRELFSVLSDFLKGTKATGSVVIQFRNGGVAGLEAIIKKVYK